MVYVFSVFLYQQCFSVHGETFTEMSMAMQALDGSLTWANTLMVFVCNQVTFFCDILWITMLLSCPRNISGSDLAQRLACRIGTYKGWIWWLWCYDKYRSTRTWTTYSYISWKPWWFLGDDLHHLSNWRGFTLLPRNETENQCETKLLKFLLWK